MIFKDFVVQGQGLEVRGQVQGLVNWSSRTRTFLEDYNTAMYKTHLTTLLIFCQRQHCRHLWREFFLCSLMTAWCRNRMEKALEIRAFLKLNKTLFEWHGISNMNLLFCWRLMWTESELKLKIRTEIRNYFCARTEIKIRNSLKLELELKLFSEAEVK